MKSVVNDIKESMVQDLTNVLKYLPVAIPATDQDKKMIDICQDMIQCMVEDINNGQIYQVVNIDALISDWSKIKPKLTGMRDKEVLDIIDQIVERGESDD